MSYNKSILEGQLVGEPIFYKYQEEEKLEFKLMTVEGFYVDKNGKKKQIKTFHKVLVYNKYYIEQAKKHLIGANSRILVQGKLSSMVDSDGCYSYALCIINNNHYLKVTSNYFYHENKPLIQDFLNEI